MVEKDIRGGICHTIQRYAKANNKYMKKYNKNIESLCIEYLDSNNLYGWKMSNKFPVNVFKWLKKLLKFDWDFIKNQVVNSNKEYILEVDVVQKI